MSDDVKKLLREAEEKGIAIQLTGSGVSFTVDIRDLVGFVAEELKRNGVPIDVRIDYEKHIVRFILPMDYIRQALQSASPRDREAIRALLDMLGA